MLLHFAAKIINVTDIKNVLFCMQTETTTMAWIGKLATLLRKYSTPIATTGVAAVTAAYFYSQTLGLRQYRRLLVHEKDGVMLPVDSETQQLIEKVFLVYLWNCVIFKDSILDDI